VVNRACTLFSNEEPQYFLKKVWEVRRRGRKEIVDSLCIRVKTVQKHQGNLMEKLSIRNIQTLITFAPEKG
jgi:FixJ family two-component response regulator